ARGQSPQRRRRPLRAPGVLLPGLLHAARGRDRPSHGSHRRRRAPLTGAMSYVVSVDSGGTFSDCVVVDSEGAIVRAKSPSTPPNFEQGVLDSVAVAADRLGLTTGGLGGPTALFF